MSLTLKNATVVTPFQVRKDCVIVIESEKISQLGSKSDVKMPKESEVIDLSGRIVIPGMIDLHIHGIGGYDFIDFNSKDADKIMAKLASHGITGVLLTLYPKKQKEFIKTLRQTVEAISMIKKNNIIWGLHLEGPFINKEMHGALNPEFIWEPDIDDWHSVYEACQGYLKLMTIAPELSGAMDIIRDAASKGVVLSIGHTKATYQDIMVAIDNGVSHVTHIYNAMQPVHHREPGVLGSCYVSDELKVELIADGIHVHPVTIKFLYKLKGAHGILLVSDAIHAAGMPDGRYEFAGQVVNIKDRKAFLDDGTLAGSCLTLDYAVKNMVELAETPVTSAVRMATLNPARVLRKDDQKGIIAVGKDADLVVMDSGFNVEMTIKQGDIIYRK